MRLKKKVDTTTMNGTMITETRARRGIQVQQSDEVDQEKQDNAAHANGLVGEEAAHGIHIRGGALDQLTGLHFGVVGEGKMLDMVEQVIAQAAGNAFGGLRGKAAAQEGKAAFDGCQSDKAQRDPVDRRDDNSSGAEIVVHKIAQQEIGAGFCQGRKPE